MRNQTQFIFSTIMPKIVLKPKIETLNAKSKLVIDNTIKSIKSVLEYHFFLH